MFNAKATDDRDDTSRREVERSLRWYQIRRSNLGILRRGEMTTPALHSRLWKALHAAARVLIFIGLGGSYLGGVADAASCPIPLTPPPPPPIYSCQPEGSGICANAACPNGSLGEIRACAEAYYYANYAQFNGCAANHLMRALMIA
jgi:hypothetical protein